MLSPSHKLESEEKSVDVLHSLRRRSKACVYGFSRRVP